MGCLHSRLDRSLCNPLPKPWLVDVGSSLRRAMVVISTDHGVFLGFDQASSHVQWMVIRSNSAFLYKRKLGTFTTVRIRLNLSPISHWSCHCNRNQTIWRIATRFVWMVSFTRKSSVWNQLRKAKVLFCPLAVWRVSVESLSLSLDHLCLIF